MSRFWLDAPSIIVVTEDDWPHSFQWRERTHPISVIANHWRVDREWWQSRIARDYFLVLTHSGLLAVIFHDWVTDSWYLQRLYD